MGCLPEAANFDFLRPNIAVPCCEIIVENLAVLVLCHAADAIPDKYADDTESKEETNEWYDGHPLLPGVFLVKPGPLNFALLDSSRSKILSSRKVLVARRSTT